LTGYVKADNLFSDRRVIGNLTISANFSTGAVTTIAGDFSQFDDGALSGTLTGSRTINLSTINSSLDGTITLSEEGTNIDTTVDGTMSGRVRDIGSVLGGASGAENDTRRLFVHGGLTGTFTTGETADDIDGGAFYAIQN